MVFERQNEWAIFQEITVQKLLVNIDYLSLLNPPTGDHMGNIS